MTITEQLESCFKKKDYDKARKAVLTYLADEGVDKNKNFVLFAQTYLDLMSKLNKAYQKRLEEIFDGLQELHKLEQEVEEKGKDLA